jgi:hypothetical protein
MSGVSPPTFSPILSCEGCGKPLDAVGRFDDKGRPWAMVVGDSVWFSVDVAGRGVFRCLRCTPAGVAP